tara:strand:+ start:1341 stop:1742 length:402 start_codon:yes stop_codon:yes gene_type:complete
MKLGQFKRFSKLCGIGKVKYKGEEFFVAFSDYMISEHSLGCAVGKGKTENEALRMALVNLSANNKKMCDEFEKINHKIRQLTICSNPLDFDKKPVFAVEDMDYDQEKKEYIHTGVFYNADVSIIDKKIYIGIR